ncbi:MAG: PH domain-containing protein [Flavobacteriales bacterium]|nr:PH domain-containing protein [Flavobacteriales bacterium]
MGEVIRPLLILRPRRWKWLGVLAIGVLFMVGGWWMAQHAHEPFKRGVGWFSLIFFGLVAVVSVIQLIPGTSRVVVTTHGLYVKSLLRNVHYNWNDIERFGVAEWTQWHGPFRLRHRYVGILFIEGSKHLLRHQHMQAWATAFWGYHASLPDNYGYQHQELADTLNGYLEASRNRA